ncbi:MAG: ABC transporter ATP-binding protein [Bacteroidota bacterium]
MSRAITTEGLRKNFGGVEAVRGLSLSVEEGEMFGLVGPDGGGKTTTLRMLCGILTPDGGTARVLDHDLGREAGEIKRLIGYLPQRFSLYGDLTVDENMEFFAEINGVRSFRPRREELLFFTRLAPFRDRLAERLSGGMKQKLALACTLIHRPRLLFLDEPTTGVDPVSRRDLWRILQSLLAERITIVMTTPYLDEAERCVRVGLLNEGALMAADTPERIRAGMEGRLLEIVCRPVRAAIRILRSEDPEAEVQAFGDRLHLFVGPRGGEKTALMERLSAGGVEVRAWRWVPPTLENAFIRLLSGGRRIREGA